MKIKGFGGVFWRTGNREVLKEWYREVLQIEMEDWFGTVITPQKGNETIFSFFTDENDYFPKEQAVMLNFQVENMDDCVEHLKKLDIPLLRETEKSEYGTFNWIADPEGRWIELWEKN
ncbi:glyoxalase [Fictibacillus nanhaiensis]|uniref:VOC family protein n=1 Tax=Fictibacillus nanhaiensis TaxID=742169 RepID=UPI001C94737A|nr:glyoxalase [Fictibacillus nanhaiensis]MBY6038041.1 glyoxalase [Fictibacillus nanhaiensis]